MASRGLSKARFSDMEMDTKSFDTLIRRLHKLEVTEQVRVLKSAVQAGLSPFKTAIQRAAPRGSEEERRGGKFSILKDSIKNVRRTYHAGPDRVILGYVGPSWPGASHGWWQEHGTKRPGMANPPHKDWARKASKTAMAKSVMRVERMLKRQMEKAFQRVVRV